MKRTWLVVVLLLVPLLAVVAAAGREADGDGGDGPSQLTEGMYGEAPEFALRVAAGELPPVDERLPKNPMVIDREIGRYGGTVRIVSRADNLSWMFNGGKTIYPESGFGTRLMGGVFESWEANDDATEFTFHIREGAKWSDGVEYTADGVKWWYEYIETYDPVAPDHKRRPREQASGIIFTSGGESMKVEVIDRYTFRFSFALPYPNFLEVASRPLAWNHIPPHYAEQFHPEFMDLTEYLDEADDDEADAKALAWQDLKSNVTQVAAGKVPEQPTLQPFVCVSYITGQGATYERNPYYFMVDADGNQLPYLDGLEVTQVADYDLRVAKIMAGEVDVNNTGYWNDIAFAEYSVLVESEARGGYKVYTVRQDRASAPTVRLNPEPTDPVLQELFQNQDFRIALSVGIDRDEINEIAFLNQGEPWNMAPRRGQIGYREGMEKIHAEYDPVRANELLDELGLSERDAAGFRLRPDGKRLSVVVQMENAEPVEASELIKEYWEALGMETLLRAVPMSALPTHTGADWEVEIVYGESGGYWVARADKWLPKNSGWAPGSWYEEGAEPPPPYARLDQLYDEALDSRSMEEFVERFEEAMVYSVDQVFSIMVLYAPLVVVVKDNLRNVRVDDEMILETSDIYAETFAWYWTE